MIWFGDGGNVAGLVVEVESARTTDHSSAHTARVEVLTRAEPRRSWTAEQKRQIVAESLGPDLTAMEVARKYRISSGQLYTWRQQLIRLPGSVATRAPMLLTLRQRHRRFQNHRSRLFLRLRPVLMD